MNTISKAQRFTILQLWGKVCKDRGWKSSDRALRLATIGKILGRDLTTLDEVERLAECTKVMAELKALLGVSLKAGMEATDPSRNRKRNWRWLITNEALPCLALYVENGMAGAQAYLLTVMLGKSRWRKTDRPETDPVLADFDERTCEQIFWTISARLNDKRKEAGHSGHEMCVAAQVKCKCAACKRAREAKEMGPVIPALPVGTDEAVETVKLLDENEPF
jgi:hypothetical protein